jgi:hypothetical protein
VNIYVESGIIRIELVDSEGNTIPPGPTYAESNKAELLGLSIGGMDPLPLDEQNAITLRIKAIDGAATFYLDAATLTQSVEPVQYRGEMGPRALWIAAAEMLMNDGGAPDDEFDGDIIDASQLDAQFELLKAGAHAEIKAFYTGGSYKVDTTARIQEVFEKADTNGTYNKRLRIARPRKTVSSRLVHRPRAPILEEAPKKQRDIGETPTPGDPGGAGLNLFCGTATIESGDTFVVVDDVLPEGVTYSGGTVSIWPISFWGNATEWKRDEEMSAGSFIIRADQDPGQDFKFGWLLVYPCPFPSEVATPLTLTCGGSGDESATWEWTTTADNDEDGWFLRYGTVEGGPYNNVIQIARGDVADPDNPEWTVEGLINGTQYCAVVTAYWDAEVTETMGTEDGELIHTEGGEQIVVE